MAGMMQRRHFSCALAGSAVAPGWALAQAPAAPASTGPGPAVASFVDGVLRQQLQPQVRLFARSATALVSACERWSSRGPNQRAAARLAWQDALRAWAGLGSLLVGPLLERRSTRRIDFAPTRTAQVEQAIAQSPTTAEDMERIGSAAKGFGALEWMLWDAKAPNDEPARRYAVMVAKDIAVEAAGLEQDFVALLARPRNPDATRELLSQILNQWVGGAEMLRMQGLERPAQAAGTGGRPALPRALSGAAALERQARWQTLRGLLVGPGDASTASAASAGLSAGPPTLEQMLQAEGHPELAASLHGNVPKVEAALRAATGNDKPGLQAAGRALAVLKGSVEFDAAPALDVQIGFSDADGD